MAESQEAEAQWRLELKDLPTLRRLGRGLSGYLYETTRGGKKCARKDFPLGSAERNSIFESEVKKVCKLDDHPNIVKCFGYTVGRNSCSLVQEYVADNLQNSVQRKIDQEMILKKGPGSSRVVDVEEIKRLLSSRGEEKEKGKRKVAGSGTFEASVPEAVGIISQIATGMRFLHENGVVHGDLKPRNVLLLDPKESGGWKVKLADYGLTETKKMIRMVSERTRCAEILTWKAPECLGKKYLDHDDPFAESDTDSDEETVDEFFKSKLAMADVYSFGLTCSYVLGGKLMSPDMSLAQLRQQRMQGFKPKLPESASLEYPKLMIDSCLQPEPLKRPTFAAICSCLGLNDCGMSLPHLPSEVCVPSSLEDRSVDLPEQVTTMSTFEGASRKIFHFFRKCSLFWNRIGDEPEISSARAPFEVRIALRRVLHGPVLIHLYQSLQQDGMQMELDERNDHIIVYGIPTTNQYNAQSVLAEVRKYDRGATILSEKCSKELLEDISIRRVMSTGTPNLPLD